MVRVVADSRCTQKRCQRAVTVLFACGLDVGYELKRNKG